MVRRDFPFPLAAWNVLLCWIVCFICLKHFVLLYNKLLYKESWLILINHLQNMNNDKKNIGLKTDTGFLTIVSRSGAWTIIFTIFIIHREVAWSSALQVQIICRKPLELCGDLEERRENHSYYSSVKDKKREKMNRAPLSLSPEFFPLIKSMWMSPQLRSKTIPLTSSDLSWPSMCSLQFNWGVYSIHTVTCIAKKAMFSFLFFKWWRWFLMFRRRERGEFSFKRSAVTHRNNSFRLRKASNNSKAT